MTRSSHRSKNTNSLDSNCRPKKYVLRMDVLSPKEESKGAEQIRILRHSLCQPKE